VQLSASADRWGGSWRVPARRRWCATPASAYVFVAREGGFAAVPVEVMVEEEGTVVAAAISASRPGRGQRRGGAEGGLAGRFCRWQLDEGGAG
jgi:hypothetical protein